MTRKASSPDAQPGWTLLFAAWIVAAGASLGSLFFSEVMGVPICVLCWYQRIALYPLVLILALGLFPYDPRVVRYAGALAGLGWLVALYHVLLVAGIVPERAQPCVQGVPCSETHISLLGFLSIPVMSLLTFTVVGVLLFWAHRRESS
jgi:disulfide bond formation protein DsbB